MHHTYPYIILLYKCMTVLVVHAGMPDMEQLDWQDGWHTADSPRNHRIITQLVSDAIGTAVSFRANDNPNFKNAEFPDHKLASDPPGTWECHNGWQATIQSDRGARNAKVSCLMKLQWTTLDNLIDQAREVLSWADNPRFRAVQDALVQYAIEYNMDRTHSNPTPPYAFQLAKNLQKIL